MLDLPVGWIVVLASWFSGVLVGYLVAIFLPLAWSRKGSTNSVVAEALVSSTPGDTDPALSPRHDDNWIISTKDLAFFQRHLGEGKDGESATAHTGGPWELMMQKEIKGLVRYTAWRRALKNGSTEYKSITLSGGVSANEFMDFYLDDVYRPRWDTMLHHTQILENVDPIRRKQVVLWRRSFPFGFISEREYVIARSLFRVGKDRYAVTKSVGEDYEHPALEDEDHSKTVRIDSYYSMWRSRDVANPWNAEAPACETVLLHHDDLKVPEHLARLTIKLGMWSFVRNIAHQVQPFVQERRKRCGVYDDDPAAFGLQPLQIEGPTNLADAATPASSTNAPQTTAANTRAWNSIEAASKRSFKHDGWTKGIQRAGWTVVILTVVRLLLLNSGGHHHEHSEESPLQPPSKDRQAEGRGREKNSGRLQSRRSDVADVRTEQGRSEDRDIVFARPEERDVTFARGEGLSSMPILLTSEELEW